MVLVTLVLVATGAAAPAWAGTDAEEADRLISSGVKLRQQSKDEEALAAFSRAYELTRNPRARAQMGLAEEALGRWERAEAHVTEALSIEDPWIAKHRNDLQAALDDIRGHLGNLEVLGGPAGAAVQLNGETVGRLPLDKPLRVAAGTVALEVRAAGFLPVVRNVYVPAGGLARETIAATRDSTSTATWSPPPSAAPVAPVAAPTIEREAPPTATRGAWRKPAAWSSAAGAAVALGVGIFFTQRAYSYADKFNAHCGTEDPLMGGGSCKSEHDTSQGAVAPAVVGFSLAGALGAASAYLFWSAHSQANAETRTSWTCSPRTTDAGLSCAAVF